MKRLNYFSQYSPDEEFFYDWRIQAMNVVEPVVIFHCQNRGLERRKGLEFDDIAQELRIRLWDKLNSWEGRSSLRTWADRVCRNRIINLLEKKREVLDSARREDLIEF